MIMYVSTIPDYGIAGKVLMDVISMNVKKGILCCMDEELATWYWFAVECS
jgi:hypothetical protein